MERTPDSPEELPKAPAPERFEIPERLVERIPRHLVPVWHANGGYLNESDFSGKRHLLKPGMKVTLSPAEREEYYGYAGRETYDIQQRRLKAEAAKFDVFLDTEEGVRFKAQALLKAEEDRKITTVQHRERLTLMKPFLDYARSRLPGQREFMAWLESEDGSAFVAPIVFGWKKDGLRIFNDAISRVGRGVQIRMAMGRADKVAAEKGLTERFNALDPDAVSQVIAGVLEVPPAKPVPSQPSEGVPETVHLTGDQPDQGMRKAIVDLMEAEMQGGKKRPDVRQRLAVMLLNDIFKKEHGIRFGSDVVPEDKAQAEFDKLKKSEQ